MPFTFSDSGIEDPLVVEAFRELSLIISALENIPIFTGTGTPEGSVTARIGSLFLRDDGGASTTLYIKETGTGNTGWVAK